jgi:hypothetical protein
LPSLLSRTDVFEKVGDNERFGGEVVLTRRADTKRYYVIEMGKAFPICHAFIIFSIFTLFIQDQAASSFFRRRSSVKA